MDLILNRFRPDQLISKDCYRGTDLKKNQKVIIYFFKDDYLVNLPKIKHPNVAQVIASGHFQGKSYLIREEVAGKDFFEFVKNQPSYAELVEVLNSVIDALEVHHQQGISHGRLDPRDIIINKKEVKVVDFSLKRSGQAGIQGDIYQLASLYFYGLTGRLLNKYEKQYLGIDVAAVNPFLNQDKRIDINKANDLIIKALQGQILTVTEFRDLMNKTVKKRSFKPILFLSLFFLLGVGLFFFLKNDQENPPIPKTTYPPAPNLVGKTLNQAKGIAKNKGIALRPTFKPGRKNRVLSQNIKPGQEVRAYLKIIVGKKVPDPIIPKLVGLDREKARKVLQELGLVATYTREPSELRAGLVLKTKPKAGKRVKKDSSVLLTVAAPSGLPKVVNFVGKSLEQARKDAAKRGLGVRIIGYVYTNDRPANIVARQRPAPGERPANKVVKFFVTSAILMPNLIGQTTNQAESELKGLELGYSVLEVAGYPKGIVFKQRPLPGQVAQGSLNIWVGSG
jgi:serine/threonine-protein kinase